MRLDRWGKIALLVSVIALLGAIVMPGALAQTPEPVVVRSEDGVLRLHLGSDADYFRFDTADGSGGYTDGAVQSIVGSCPLTAVGTEGQPQWATLVGGKIGSSFSLSQVGLKNDSLGVKYLNCDRVDAPNWALRLGLGSAADLDPDAPEPPAVDVAIDYAEIELEGFSNVTVVADLMLHGTTVATLEKAIGGSGTNVRWIIGNHDDPGRTNVLFDQIRLRPKKWFTSFSLEGGAEGTAPRGSLGTILDTNDSLFRVVSETQFADSLTCDESLTEGGDGTPAATLSRPADASSCDQEAAVTLITRPGEVEILKDTSVLTELELQVAWEPEPATNPAPATEIDYGDGAGPHPMAWCLADGEDAGTFPDLPAGEFWCITAQDVQLLSDGTIQLTEDYFGFGDPKIFR